MKLNAVEKVLMNNPARAAIQRHYEGPLLERLGGTVDGAHVLEVGCGRGVGTQIILDRFRAEHVTAFDIDPDMVETARQRLASHLPHAVTLSVGDVTDIDAADATFDAVFDFGIIHHAPDWRSGLREMRRVLRPDGRFYFEEVTRHALQRWSYRTFLDHPDHDRFSGAEFVSACEDLDLTIGDRWTEKFFGDFVIGVATRTS